MGDLAFIRNVIETLPSLVEMARLHPELSHEAVAARWLSVPSSYMVPLSYTASEELSDTIQQAEADLAVLKGRRCDECDSREGQSHYCLLLSINTGDAFYCDFWTARAEEGGEK